MNGGRGLRDGSVLRVLVALSENSGSVLSTQLVNKNHSNSSLQVNWMYPVQSSGLLGTWMHKVHVYIRTHTQTHK